MGDSVSYQGQEAAQACPLAMSQLRCVLWPWASSGVSSGHGLAQVRSLAVGWPSVSPGHGLAQVYHQAIG